MSEQLGRRPPLIAFLELAPSETLSMEKARVRLAGREYPIALQVTKTNADEEMTGSMTVTPDMAEEARIWALQQSEHPQGKELERLLGINLGLNKILVALEK
jgi:hypothetical protein